MHHETLGDITRENDGDDGVARVSYGDRTIEIRVILDDVPYEETVDLAARGVKGIVL